MSDEELQAFWTVDDAICAGRYRDAFELASPWAEANCGWAENGLGSLYACGFGAPLDTSLAIHYYERAAAHGVAGAWYALGTVYSTGGENVPANDLKAAECYRKAEDLGYVLGAPHDFALPRSRSDS